MMRRRIWLDNNANPTLRPHVMNNSWGCPASEGCVTRAELETIVNNTQAAGIFVEVSRGKLRLQLFDGG